MNDSDDEHITLSCLALADLRFWLSCVFGLQHIYRAKYFDTIGLIEGYALHLFLFHQHHLL